MRRLRRGWGTTCLWGGGGDCGFPDFGPGTPAMGWGVQKQEKSNSGPGSHSTHSPSGTLAVQIPLVHCVSKRSRLVHAYLSGICRRHDLSILAMPYKAHNYQMAKGRCLRLLKITSKRGC